MPRPSSAPANLILDGRLEKGRLSPIVAALLGLILAFILFQGISLIVTIALLILSGVGISDLVENLNQVLADNAGSLLIANSVGQVFGLLIPALLFARLHSSRWKSYLRLNRVDLPFLLLSIIALIALIPVVQWIGTLSDGLPWPESIRQFEQSQMDLIERILTRDFSLVFSIIMLAMTPAICEEVLFRGYVQRQAERSIGIWGGILFSGIIFGLYHLRITQAIPLSMLGVFMAYLTWRSSSLIPAMLVHFSNNSFAAILGKMATREGSRFDLETFKIPLSVVLPAALVLAATLYLLHGLRHTQTEK